jgi:YcaO-like protein with predicted kinase domain
MQLQADPDHCLPAPKRERPEIGSDKHELYSDRACGPEETLLRIAPLFHEWGITRLARITGLDRIGIPVWNAIRPNARSIAIHQGKGIRDIDAQVSAGMEALERAMAEQPDLPRWTGAMADAKRHDLVLDPLEGLLARGSGPLGPDDCADWVQGQDLLSGNPVWTPLEAVRLDRTQPSRYWQSSDGLASGNTPDEAVLHALLERIERDAEIIWKLDGLERNAKSCVNPRRFSDPIVNHLLDKIEMAGFRMQMFDMTSDIGIPVYSALLAPQNIDIAFIGYKDVTLGSGCHPIAHRAAIRAITEAVQSRLTLISGARDDVPPELYAAPLPAHLVRDLQYKPHSAIRDNALPPGATLSDMLQFTISQLREAKVGRAIIVRINPSEQRMVVVKALVPGLENPDGARRSRFGPRALKKLMVFR